METTNKCPGCSHHCDKNNLQCSKGEAYFSGESTPDTARSQGHRGGKHHGSKHHRPEFPAGSLPDLLAKCGYRLFHGADTSMFAALTDEETSGLKMLLNKIVNA